MRLRRWVSERKVVKSVEKARKGIAYKLNLLNSLHWPLLWLFSASKTLLSSLFSHNSKEEFVFILSSHHFVGKWIMERVSRLMDIVSAESEHQITNFSLELGITSRSHFLKEQLEDYKWSFLTRITQVYPNGVENHEKTGNREERMSGH